MPVPLTPDQLARDLGLRDLTDRAAGPHAIQLLVATAVDALSTAWGSQVRVERGSRVASLADNYDRLRYAARERLGMQPFHKNVLVRVTIRPFDRTLTDTDANIIRDRVYDAIHQGSAGQWSTR